MSDWDDIGLDDDKGGDMVFENAVLYLRDELLLREMADPIKVRGSVRVVLVLKFLAASYQGAENVKYAHEMMQLLYFFKHVWSPGLRYVASRVLVARCTF